MTLKTNKTKPKNKSLGFTIVELLVVIVVIGILAAITIVGYVGITKKANQAAFMSDLASAKKQISLYYTEHGIYPTSLQDGTNCLTNDTLTPPTDTNYCLKSGSGNVFSLSNVTATTYLLKASKGTVAYEVTESLSPYNSTKIPITAMGAITGTTQVSQTLTAGSITPSDATVNYQWQSSATLGGTYTNIVGATSNTLALPFGLIGKYIKLTVTANDSYSGVLTSNSTTIITDPNWITVGSQTWASANLNVGTRINSTITQANNAIAEKYCYNDTESNCTANGGLYMWDEAMGYSATEGAQGICPADSHIPSDNDWKILEMQLGMAQAAYDATGWRGTNEGVKVKSGGSSGLNIPAVGIRDYGGSTGFPGSTNLWTSTSSGGGAWARGVTTVDSNIARATLTKAYGFTVRCLVD